MRLRRGSASIASRCAGAISLLRTKCPMRGRRHLGHRCCAGFRRLCRTARQSARRHDWDELAGDFAAPKSKRRMRRSRACALCREERARTVRRGARLRRYRRAQSKWSLARLPWARGSRRCWRKSAPMRSASIIGRVRVVHGRTDQIAFGMGAFASRATVMTGEATRLAAVEVRAKALAVAAELMQQPAERSRSSTAWCAAQGTTLPVLP